MEAILWVTSIFKSFTGVNDRVHRDLYREFPYEIEIWRGPLSTASGFLGIWIFNTPFV